MKAILPNSNRFALLWLGLPVLAAVILLFLVVRGSPFHQDNKNGDSFAPAISGDGRYIVFSSFDRSLLDEFGLECPDEEICWNVFVKDRTTGEILLASTNSEGEQAVISEADVIPRGDMPITAGPPVSGLTRGEPVRAAISEDGRYVVFASRASNFGISEGGVNLFRKDMESGELLLVAKTEMPAPSVLRPAMSGDGRFIAFWSYQQPMGQAQNGLGLYVRDITAAEPEQVSLEGLPSIWPSQAPNPVAISGDGRYLVFATGSMVTGPAPSADRSEVFLKDRQTGELRAVSTSSDDEPGNGSSQGASISADGRLAVFESAATNLVPEQTCTNIRGFFCSNVYLKDLESGQTILLSKTASEAAMNNAGSPVISKGGGSVAFVTLKVVPPTSQKEVAFTSPLKETIYLSDLRGGQTAPVTPEAIKGDSAGGTETAPSNGPNEKTMPLVDGLAGGQGIGISADGGFIVFPSYPSWLGMEDRMCASRFSGGENPFGFTRSAPPSPCIEIFLIEVLTGGLSRISALAK